MPDFTYAAVDRQGKTFRGHLEEDDQMHAIERVKEMGLFPTQLSLSTRSPALPQPARHQSVDYRPPAIPWWQRRGLSRRHLADFTRELATLIESGIPLVRGLRAIARQ